MDMLKKFKFKEPSAKEKEGDDKKKGPEEVKIITVGPWGGNSGAKFDDGTFSGIREIRIAYDRLIHSIEVVYDKDGNPTEKFVHGRIDRQSWPNLKFAEIKLESQESFTKVNGNYGSVYDPEGEPIFYFVKTDSQVRSLTFEIRSQDVLRTCGPYGVERGRSFSFTTDGNKIVGLMGRSDSYVNAIGFHMSAPLSVAPPPNPLKRDWAKVRSICIPSQERRRRDEGPNTQSRAEKPSKIEGPVNEEKKKEKEPSTHSQDKESSKNMGPKGRCHSSKENKNRGRDFSSTNQRESMNSVGKVIGQQLGYIFHENKSRVKELQDCTVNLRSARDLVQQLNGRKINDRVKHWLEKVDAMFVEIERILQDEKMASCSNGLFPKLGSKHHLNSRAINIKQNVDQLLQQAPGLEESKKGFVSGNEIVDTIMNAKRDSDVRMNGTYGLSDEENRILVKQILSRRKDDIVQEYDQSLGSRNRTLEKIMEALKGPKFAIGIGGQGGMGKTTLAKEVARRAKEEKLFDKVGVVSVSRNLDTKEIQSQIADVMELKLEEKNVIGRAQILADSLYRQKSLIILDDMWERNQLKRRRWLAGGMPSKILLTSRSSLLLSEYVEEEYMFPVGVLEEMEAKRLLRKAAGIVEELQDSAFELLVDKFAIKTCALSPHLILSIGSYLRGKSRCQWKIALKMLQDIKFTEFALQDMPYPTELSFRQLPGRRDTEALRYAFLLWAQMGHHLSFIDFVKYHCSLFGTGPGLLDLSSDCKYISEGVFRHLKQSNSVLNSYSSGHITMRDEFRDFALSVSSNQHNFFTMCNGKLEKWLKNDELKSCTAIILHSSVIINELPKGIHCPQLKVFHLESNDPFLKIPNKFFEGMSNLRAVELIGIQLPILPSSISYLKLLKMLSLERCMICDNLSIIGELRQCLRILSLSGSSIESLPNELGKLDLLELFDISNCPKLKVIPREVLSSLESLEHFYTRNSLIKWWVEGQENQSQNASLAELTHLPHLIALEIDCPDVAAITTNVLFDELKTYKIVIGNSNELSFNATKIPNENEVSKSLAVLQLKEGANSQKEITSLFKGVENLLLGHKVYGIQNVYRDMNLKDFSYLKYLSIVNNLGIQYIINSEDLLEEAFPSLESLEVSECHSMKEIIAPEREKNSTKVIGSDQLSPGLHFQNLMKLNVKACGNFRCLLSFSMAACLANLTCLSVTGCEMMEEIIAQEINTNDAEVIIFPKLKELHLLCMKRLRIIWHNHGGPNSYSMLDSVIIEECKNLITIFPNHMMGRTPSLVKLKVVNCPLVEEIFDINDTAHLNEAKVTIFPKLRTIWHSQGGPNSYSMLDSVVIEDCKNLVTIFPNHMVGRTPSLVKLKVVNCPLVEEIVDINDTAHLNEAKVSIFPKLEELHLSHMERLTTIWNRQDGLDSCNALDYVIIEECPKLITIFPNHMLGRIPLLTTLKVVNCQSVEEIFDVNETQPYVVRKETCLRSVHIEALPNLKLIWNRDPKGILSFNYLKKVWVSKCPNLKNLIPISMASDLEYIESLTIRDCNMEEIV